MRMAFDKERDVLNSNSTPKKFLNFSWACQHKILEQPWLWAESCPAVLLWPDSRIVRQASEYTKYSSHSTMLTHCIASSDTSLFFSVLHSGVCIILYLHASENSLSVYNPWEPLLVLTRSLESLLFSFCSLHFQWVWYRDTFAMHRNTVKTTHFLLRRLHTTAVKLGKDWKSSLGDNVPASTEERILQRSYKCSSCYY